MIRCLGGFEVRLGDRTLDGFESQKVRALLIFLLFHRDRRLSRDRLASLLWPEKDEEAARRNLRQAVYNLKQVLPAIDDRTEAILADRDHVALHSQLAIWFDVDEFHRSRKRGLVDERVDPHYLAEAAGVYRGDLLQAFSIKDSSEFEHWLTHERTQLREQAASVYKTLVECYLARGEIRLGTRYAHRLATIDPLSEEAHGYLIQLYGYSGRRSRAVAQYETLRRLLDEELGIEPSAETQKILAVALSEGERDAIQPEEGEPVGPLLPLVGRRSPFEQLEAQWRRALDGGRHVTLVCGEPGVGKTRLVRSFLDSVSSRSGTTVLKGRCDEAIPRPYQPIAQVLQNAFTSHTGEVDFSLEMVSMEVLREVARLLPDLADLLTSPPAAIEAAEGRRQLFSCIAKFLDLFVGSGDTEEAGALILFLDDLDAADQDSLQTLRFLIRRSGPHPLWIVATCDSNTRGSLLEHLGEDADSADHAIELQRLDALASEEIAASLVDDRQAAALADFLVERGGGLPVAITAWVNYLWDEGILRSVDGDWRLTRTIDDLPLSVDGSVDHLVLQRLSHLPSSTRRLATLASIIGQQFTADLLQEAEDEHMTVIDLGLQILLERWLIQRHVSSWSTPHSETGNEPSGRETAGDTFEFSHRRIQQAIYRAVSPDRRRYLHHRLAQVLATRGGTEDRQCESMAFHLSHAGQWQEAFPYLRQAARKAAAVMAEETATFYYEKADMASAQAAESSEEQEHLDHWRSLRQELQREYRSFVDQE